MAADRVRRFKPLVFLLCLAPAVYLVWSGAGGQLSADPIKTLLHETGIWSLRFLLITLAISPLRKLTGAGWWLRYRRMLGLYAFFYAFLHLLVYALLDLGLYWPQLLEDIAKRPYITVGFTAFVLLIPLAATSTKGMMRRLGRRWKTLHKLVYLIAPLGVVHFIWQVKADLLEPLIYGAILALLLLFRLFSRAPPGKAATPASSSAAGPA